MSAEKRPTLTPVEGFFLGGASAVVVKGVEAPIERVKLLLQNQSEIVTSGRLAKPYKGVKDCIVRTFKTEGTLSFWRGYVISCIAVIPTQALHFGFNAQLKKTFLQGQKEDNFATKLGKNVACGGLAGSLSLTLVYSLSYCRIRLANDVKVDKVGQERQFSGIIDVYRKTLASDGIAGLYRGFVISCVGITVYRGFYFGLFDTLRPLIMNNNPSYVAQYCLGFGVTIVAGLLAYPFDTIHSRMLMRSGETVKYRGSLDCFSQIVKKESFLSLMRGAGVSIVRGMVGAAMLVGYNKIMKAYTSWRFA